MSRISRRGAIKLGAATAALPLVHIRTGRAAGRVSLGFWDHWVPAGNAVLKQQCDAWGAKIRWRSTSTSSPRSATRWR